MTFITVGHHAARNSERQEGDPNRWLKSRGVVAPHHLTAADVHSPNNRKGV